MSDAPYREAYRVEESRRPPNAEEWARIRARRTEHLAMSRKHALSGSRELLGFAAVAFGVALVGLALGKPAVAFAGGLVFVFCGGLGLVGRRRGVAYLAQRKSPWTEPDDAWVIHETRIVARSLVYAASGDEDYVTWLLFEIPRGEWVALDDLWIPPPPSPRGDQLARAEVRVTWAMPSAECLSVDTFGDPIPRRGALRLGEPYDGDDFAAALEAGFEWTEPYEPGDESPASPFSPVVRVSEDELPAWMRQA